MKNKWLTAALILVPIFTLTLFLYMTFFNAAYELPGRITYYEKCANCHGDRGQGIELLVPPLLKADYFEDYFEEIPCLILNGMTDTIEVNGKSYYQPMYPIKLNGVEMANLMNFLRDTFCENYNKYKPFRSSDMNQKMKSCN